MKKITIILIGLMLLLLSGCSIGEMALAPMNISDNTSKSTDWGSLTEEDKTVIQSIIYDGFLDEIDVDHGDWQRRYNSTTEKGYDWIIVEHVSEDGVYLSIVYYINEDKDFLVASCKIDSVDVIDNRDEVREIVGY